jgi:cardiolipin synthase
MFFTKTSPPQAPDERPSQPGARHIRRPLEAVPVPADFGAVRILLARGRISATALLAAARRMTTANKITILRILLIPVFVLCALYYGESCENRAPQESWRWTAVFLFIFAAITDGIDGFIARHFNQRSRLGSILDPIADKGLLLAAILTLSFGNWPDRFPLWFPILIVARDVLAICGALLLGQLAGLRELKPHWTGKFATVGQMAAVGALMLQLPALAIDLATWVAAVFTVASGMIYLRQGVNILQASGEGEPDNHRE